MVEKKERPREDGFMKGGRGVGTLIALVGAGGGGLCSLTTSVRKEHSIQAYII